MFPLALLDLLLAFFSRSRNLNTSQQTTRFSGCYSGRNAEPLSSAMLYRSQAGRKRTLISISQSINSLCYSFLQLMDNHQHCSLITLYNSPTTHSITNTGVIFRNNYNLFFHNILYFSTINTNSLYSLIKHK